MKTQLTSEKARVRAQIRTVLAAMSPEERASYSALARELLIKQDVWRRAVTVLFYAPLPGELDVWPLVLEGFQIGKRVVLPRFNSVTRVYVPAVVNDPQREVVLGQFGIREPSAACTLVPGEEIDLVLVPGVAFDLRGYRLGRGKGYYDRLLRSVGGTKCGVAFDQQVVPQLPVEPHDYRLHCILTPTSWITFGED